MKTKNQLLNACLVLTTALFSCNVTADDIYSNVEPIPNAFEGRWAGLHEEGEPITRPLTSAIIRDLCKNGGEQSQAYFITFDSGQQTYSTNVYWEDEYISYPISYTKYEPDHIMGKEMTLNYYYDVETDENGELYDVEKLASKYVGDFNLRIVGDTLRIGVADGKYFAMKKCS